MPADTDNFGRRLWRGAVRWAENKPGGHLSPLLNKIYAAWVLVVLGLLPVVILNAVLRAPSWGKFHYTLMSVSGLLWIGLIALLIRFSRGVTSTETTRCPLLRWRA